MIDKRLRDDQFLVPRYEFKIYRAKKIVKGRFLFYNNYDEQPWCFIPGSVNYEHYLTNPVVLFNFMTDSVLEAATTDIEDDGVGLNATIEIKSNKLLRELESNFYDNMIGFTIENPCSKTANVNGVFRVERCNLLSLSFYTKKPGYKRC